MSKKKPPEDEKIEASADTEAPCPTTIPWLVDPWRPEHPRLPVACMPKWQREP